MIRLNDELLIDDKLYVVSDINGDIITVTGSETTNIFRKKAIQYKVARLERSLANHIRINDEMDRYNRHLIGELKSLKEEPPYFFARWKRNDEVYRVMNINYMFEMVDLEWGNIEVPFIEVDIFRVTKEDYLNENGSVHVNEDTAEKVVEIERGDRYEK